MQFASLWITACIHLHTFAIDHEDAKFITRDRFYRLGQKIIRKEGQEWREWIEEREREAEQIEHDIDVQGEIELLEGKLK